MARLKTSRQSRDQVLGAISAEKAERLLVDWSNLRGEWPQIENEASLLQMTSSVERLCRRYRGELEACPSILVFVLRGFLRKAWDASDPRQRDWWIYKFRDFYLQTVLRVNEVRGKGKPGRKVSEMPVILPTTRDEALESTGPRNDPPPVTGIEAAAFYFQRNAGRARRCL